MKELITSGAMDFDAWFQVAIEQRKDLLTSETFNRLFDCEGNHRDFMRDHLVCLLSLLLLLAPGKAHVSMIRYMTIFIKIIKFT